VPHATLASGCFKYSVDASADLLDGVSGGAPLLAVAITDSGWLEFLREQPFGSGRINFWTPTPWNIRQMNAGDEFWFHLKAPDRKLGGFGHFVEYRNCSVQEAWDRYGPRNGVESLEHFRARRGHYASTSLRYGDEASASEAEIGCVILERSVFFDASRYIDPPLLGLAVSPEVVKFKYFDIPPVEYVGTQREAELLAFSSVSEDGADFESSRRRLRVGQSEFRQRVLTAYGHACALTGETAPEILEAAHIEPYVNVASNHVQNGIALRVDLHRLFDAGLLGITSSGEVQISRSLVSEEYRSLHGTHMRMPQRPRDQPSKQALERRFRSFRPTGEG